MSYNLARFNGWFAILTKNPSNFKITWVIFIAKIKKYFYFWFSYASLTAFASWSAHDVPRPLQSFPESFSSIYSTL